MATTNVSHERSIPVLPSTSLVETLHPIQQHLSVSAISPVIHVTDSSPVSDPERERTESLLQNVDLSVLCGKKNKKKNKKKLQVSVIPLGTELLSPWLSNLGMTEYESKHQRLHDEIVAFTRFVSPSPAEVEARRLIVSAVQAAADEIFKQATLSIFGSVATDLCLPNDDIDLTIIADIPSHLGTRSFLHELSSGLRFAQISENSRVISRSRVPVITLTTIQPLASSLVDISINADKDIKAVNIVRGFLNKMPALRPLVLVLKQMLSQCGLDSTAIAGLSTYCLICMVISFLQVNPNKRSIQVIEHPMENESLGMLLFDFLSYYTDTFEYATSRICVTSPDGKLLDKPHSTDSVNSFTLSISCLVNPDNDICRPTMKLERLISAFRDALIRIDNYPFSIWHNNCLGTIIGIPQTILDRRERVSQLVTSGSMEAQIGRSIAYMAKINPIFYRQKSRVSRDNNSEASFVNVEATGSSSARGYDSYRPEDDADSGWTALNEKRRNSPEYKADYFGSRAMAYQASHGQKNDEPNYSRGRARSVSREQILTRSSSNTRGSSAGSRSRGRSSSMRGDGETVNSMAEGRERGRETKRRRVE